MQKSNFILKLASIFLLLTQYAFASDTSVQCALLLDDDLFNANVYRKYNSDLRSQKDDQVLKLHWCQHGVSEGRQASEIFFSKEYLQLNPLLRSIIGQDYRKAAIMYITSPNYGRLAYPGVKIGSSPFFDYNYYQKRVNKVFNTINDARRDFILNGLPQGVEGSAQFKPVDYFLLNPEYLSKCVKTDVIKDYICAAQDYRDYGIIANRQAVLSVNFNSWAALASAHNVSPVVIQPGDLFEKWVAPDSRTVIAVVQAPQIPKGSIRVDLEFVPQGADARPAFERALQKVKSLKASILNIPKGTYTFKTVYAVAGRDPHLYLKNLKDVIIEGNDSTFLFTKDNNGIVIESSHRLKLNNIKIDYLLRTTSLGQIIIGSDGTKQLKIDSEYPVSASDGLAQLQEYDRLKQQWFMGKNAERVLFPSATAYSFAGSQIYKSNQFKNLTVGKTFAVMHHWYKGAAIYVTDSRNKNESQDIWLNNVSIYSGPGMGVIPYGIKRGFAMTGCKIIPKPNSNRFMSVEWDAVHLQLVGGDTIIKNNEIAAQGDDGLNMNSPVSPILSFDLTFRQLVLGQYSRFVGVGDRVAFFDLNGNYLGIAKAITIQAPQSGYNYTITFDQPVHSSAKFARNLELINNRSVVKNNTFSHGAILVQTPNALIENNYIHNSLIGIRLVANLGGFKEGVGVMNSIVRSNTINNSGFVMSDLKVPWGTISIVGRAVSGYLKTFVHKNIVIENNLITNAEQGCITVINVVGAVIRQNICNNTNQTTRLDPSIRVHQSQKTKIENNTRSGQHTGNIHVDALSVTDFSMQANY